MAAARIVEDAERWNASISDLTNERHWGYGAYVAAPLRLASSISAIVYRLGGRAECCSSFGRARLFGRTDRPASAVGQESFPALASPPAITFSENRYGARSSKYQ